MSDLNLDGLKELTRDAFRDVSDADRCVGLQITPATGTLHRRLRETANAMNVLIREVEQQRMIIALMTGPVEAFNKLVAEGVITGKPKPPDLPTTERQS